MNVSITPVLAINRKKGRFWGSNFDYYPKCGISIVVLKSAYLANLPPNRVVPTFPLEFINYVIYKYSLVLTTNKPSHLCLMLFPMSVAKGRPLVPLFLATRIMDKEEELLLEPPRYTTSSIRGYVPERRCSLVA